MGHFLSFNPLTVQKSKLKKKVKKPPEISWVYISASKINIISCAVPKIWHVTDVIVIFFILGYLLPFQHPPPPPLSLTTRKIKMKKWTWRYYHFTHVYHKWQSYDVWFLKYGAWQTEESCTLSMRPHTNSKKKCI